MKGNIAYIIHICNKLALTKFADIFVTIFFENYENENYENYYPVRLTNRQRFAILLRREG